MSQAERILEYLYRHPADSYAAMAKELNISQALLQTALSRLRDEGFFLLEDEGGYRQFSDIQALCAKGVRHYLAGIPLCANGCTVEVHETISSTNNRLRELAQAGACKGSIVIARRQTAGRGRRGRDFHSPADGGLYMSLLLRPAIPAEEVTRLTLYAAVAVVRAIRRLLPEAMPQIKWVNDIFLGGRKVCGILCDAVTDCETGKLCAVVVGIGVNVDSVPFPPALSAIATSLEEQVGRRISRMALAGAITEEIDGLLRKGDFTELLAEYRALCFLWGKEVTVQLSYRSFPATAVDISPAGELLVETEEGRLFLSSGEVSLRL